MTKDNIIETVPLSAIRKVIELDAQDARELRAVAAEMLQALQFFCDTTGPMFFNITPETEGTLTTDRQHILRAYRAAQKVMQKAKVIL